MTLNHHTSPKWCKIEAYKSKWRLGSAKICNDNKINLSIALNDAEERLNVDHVARLGLLEPKTEKISSDLVQN